MLDLDAIKARLAGAAAGPWQHYYFLVSSLLDEVDEDGTPLTTGVASACDEPTAKFIAHVPTDIQALIAEVERLRNESAFLREWLRGELTLADADIDQELMRALPRGDSQDTPRASQEAPGMTEA